MEIKYTDNIKSTNESFVELRIKETFNYLKEDIDAVKKYYPNIPDDVFMQLISLDPTYRDRSNSVGTYGKWLLNLYNKGNLTEDEFEDVSPALSMFHKYRKVLENKDIGKYKSLQELIDAVSGIDDETFYDMMTPSQKVRYKKRIKSRRIKLSSEDDYDVVFENSNFIIYVPNTHEASMYLGAGTDWCTAHENPDWYNKYTQDGHKLYIIKNKDTGERWQYSDMNGDILDSYDEEFDYFEAFYDDEELADFLWKLDSSTFIDLPKITETGFLKIDSVDELPDVFKEKLIYVVVIPYDRNTVQPYSFEKCYNLRTAQFDANIEFIGRSAFIDCESLEDVRLPINLLSLDSGVFRNCTSLKTITLPTSLTTIGDHCFAQCESLKFITIPDKVTELENSIFEDCESLELVVLPKNLTHIGSRVFCNCYFLESIVIPDSVIEIGENVFYGCDDIVVYTNSEEVKKVLEAEGIDVRPNTKTEGVRNNMKLKIIEDTACVASKTSYIDDTGKDKNGIYYFGKKPKLPVSWRDYKRNHTNNGAYNESIGRRYMLESVAEEYGQFTMLDDEVGNFEGNMSEDDIDKALVYLQKVSKILKAPLSKIVFYRCNEDYLDPTNQKTMFDLTRIYNRNSYDSYEGTVNGKKFIVDHFDTRAEFDMYATDEETIKEVIEQMEQSY